MTKAVANEDITRIKKLQFRSFRESGITRAKAKWQSEEQRSTKYFFAIYKIKTFNKN